VEERGRTEVRKEESRDGKRKEGGRACSFLGFVILNNLYVSTVGKFVC